MSENGIIPQCENPIFVTKVLANIYDNCILVVNVFFFFFVMNIYKLHTNVKVYKTQRLIKGWMHMSPAPFMELHI